MRSTLLTGVGLGWPRGAAGGGKGKGPISGEESWFLGWHWLVLCGQRQVSPGQQGLTVANRCGAGCCGVSVSRSADSGKVFYIGVCEAKDGLFERSR